MDVSKCVLMDGALGAIVILADVNQPNADLTMQDIDGLLQQVCNKLANMYLCVKSPYTSSCMQNIILTHLI